MKLLVISASMDKCLMGTFQDGQFHVFTVYRHVSGISLKQLNTVTNSSCISIEFINTFAYACF